MKRIACAFSVSREFLDQIDARADELGLSRSAYIVQVLRKELISGASQLSIVAETSTDYSVKTPRKSAKALDRKKT